MQHLIRNALIVYWLGFVLFAAREARFEGFTHHQGAVSYPFVDLAKMAVLLGIFTWLLSKFLNYSGGGKRLSGVVRAWLFSLALLAYFTITDATCMPGLFYVPFEFAWCSVVGTTAYGGFLWCAFAWTKRHPEFDVRHEKVTHVELGSTACNLSSSSPFK